MSIQPDNIIQLLTPFGLSSEESEVYVYILEHGISSALTISTDLHKGRTKIYRVLDVLDNKGLVNVIVDEHGKKFEANSPTHLERMISEKEIELESLKQSKQKLFTELEKITSQTHGKSKILFYRGVDGLKQITWNSLKATDGIRIYEIDTMSAFLKPAFAEKVRSELVKRNIFTKQLTNKKYQAPYTKHTQKVRKLWELRYINPDTLTMNMEFLLYNDVYALYSFEGEEIFGVEIYNAKHAAMQKQIFDFIFSHAQKMEILSDQGEARLIET